MCIRDRVVDGPIVILGAYVFGITRAMYAIIAIFVTSWISDYLLEGVNFAKVAFIITEKRDEVAAEILTVSYTHLDVYKRQAQTVRQYNIKEGYSICGA